MITLLSGVSYANLSPFYLILVPVSIQCWVLDVVSI